MSLGGPDIPAAPGQPLGSLIDPIQLSGVQQAYNIGAGVTNQAGSFPQVGTPLYQQSYSQIGTGPGGVPIYGITQGFTDPQAQANYNLYNQNQGVAGGYFPYLASSGSAFATQAAPWSFSQGANYILNQAPNALNQASGTLGTAMGTLGLSNQDLGLSNQYLTQANNYLSPATGDINLANQDFARANQMLPAATNTLDRTVSPLIGMGTGTMAGGNMWAGTAGQEQRQAIDLLNRYQLQNPNMMGDMAQGLTGQRMQAAVAGIAPFQTEQRQQLDNTLKNQGLHPGMPGYDNAMQELDVSQNMAISNFESQFMPQSWQQATQIYQDPLSKAQAQMAGVASDLGIGSQYGNLGSLYGNLAGIGINQAGQYVNAANAQAGIGQNQLGSAAQRINQAGQQANIANAQTNAAQAQTGVANAQTGVAGQQAGIGAQYGALGNAMTNIGQSYGNLGSTLSAGALPYLAASSPSLPPNPQWPGLNIQPANVLGAGTAYNSALNQNYGNQLSAYNAQLQQNNNMLSGLFGIGGSVLGGLAGGLF